MTFHEAMKLYCCDKGIIHLMSRDRRERLAEILELPFDKDLHYPLTYLHLYYADLEAAEKLLNHVEDKTDETYLQLEDFYKALEECEKSNIGLFPLDISYREWWNGPHLDFPVTLNDQEMTKWYPIRVDCIINNKVCVSSGDNREKGITYFTTELPIEHFEKFNIQYYDINYVGESSIDGRMGEMAFYNDDYIVKLHEERDWKLSPELAKLEDLVFPYIKNSNRKLNEWIQEECYDKGIV